MAAKKIILVNTGLCVMFFNGEKLMPEQEMEVKEKDLELPGIESAIMRGELTVKDNSELNAEVKERVSKRKKKDPDDGKTKDQLEDGGEYK